MGSTVALRCRWYGEDRTSQPWPAQSQWSSYRSTALRDAFSQQADGAEDQSVHYAAALTMLAVAVFLLGYSLTPQGRALRRLYSTATVASGVSVQWEYKDPLHGEIYVGMTWGPAIAASTCSGEAQPSVSSVCSV